MKTHELRSRFMNAVNYRMIKGRNLQESYGGIGFFFDEKYLRGCQSIFQTPEMEMTDDGTSECERADLLL